MPTLRAQSEVLKQLTSSRRQSGVAMWQSRLKMFNPIGPIIHSSILFTFLMQQMPMYHLSPCSRYDMYVITLYTRPIWYLSEANDPWKWLSLSRPLVCNELPWTAPCARALAKCDANCIFPISISSLYSAHAQTHSYSYQEKKGHDNATRWLLFFPWYQGFAHPVNSTPTFFVC